MNDTLKAAGRIGAELGAAKAENDRLRGLLQQVVDCQAEHYGDGCGLHLSMITLAGRIKDALSQQAESECRCTMRERTVGDGCSVCNPELAAELEGDEPAPAQDEQPAVFWVLFDATGPERFIKKDVSDGTLAFFDSEDEAQRAKRRHPGTDYKRVEYYRAPIAQTALSAVTAERDRLREEMAELWKRIDKFQSQSHGITALAEIERLRAEVERLRAGGNRTAARETIRRILPDVPGDLLDHALFAAHSAAMAAKGA